MVRRFYNYTCSIYSLAATTVRGSSVQSKTLVYEDIPCALWKARRSYSETSLATQTNQNAYEVNLAPIYTDVAIGYVIDIEGVQYKVDDMIKHHNSRGKLDNLQVFVSKSTND